MPRNTTEPSIGSAGISRKRLENQGAYACGIRPKVRAMEIWYPMA